MNGVAPKRPISDSRQKTALSVVIPHYNDPDRLAKCLAALVPQLTDHPDATVVVADNASPCDLSSLEARFPQVIWITETQKGAAAARNAGASVTQGGHIAFLDSDCVPAPDWLSEGLRLATEAPDTVYGGRVDTFDETPAPRSGAEAFETVFAFKQRSYIADKGFSVSANLLVPRSVWEATGPMVPGLAEDVDWCQRATATGARLCYAEAWSVSHPTRQNWPALVRKWRRTTNEMFQTGGLTPAARLRWGVRAFAVLGSAVIHVPIVLKDERLSLREKLAGIGTLARLRATRCGWMLAQAVSPTPLAPRSN